jgi:hypothetical protein
MHDHDADLGQVLIAELGSLGAALTHFQQFVEGAIEDLDDFSPALLVDG